MTVFKAPQVTNAGTDDMAFRLPSIATKDVGNVRLGGQGPIFRLPLIHDAGKVRLGGQGPVFR